MAGRRNVILLVVLAATLLLPALAAAEPAEPPPQTALPWQTAEYELPWARMVGGTLFIIGLLCVGVFALKRLDGNPLRRGRCLDVLESRAVGRRLELHLVRVAGRVILIAAGEHAVARVAEFPEQELPLEPETAQEGAESPAFHSLFRRLAGAER